MALEVRCFGADEGLFNYRQLRALLKNPRALWLIEDDFSGAACLLIAANRYTRWGRLYSLSVDPRFRQQGIARRLVEQAFVWFREQKLDTCRAEVKIDNIGARRLYASLGFTEKNLLPHYYGLNQHGLRLVRKLD